MGTATSGCRETSRCSRDSAQMLDVPRGCLHHVSNAAAQGQQWAQPATVSGVEEPCQVDVQQPPADESTAVGPLDDARLDLSGTLGSPEPQGPHFFPVAAAGPGVHLQVCTPATPLRPLPPDQRACLSSRLKSPPVPIPFCKEAKY